MSDKEPAKARGRGQGYSYEIELDDGCKMYDDALEEAYEELESKGISVERERPRFEDGRLYDGRLPADYASYEMGDLAELHRVVTEWADYVGHHSQMAKNEKIAADEKLDLAKRRIRKSKTGNKEDKDDDTAIDERYVKINADAVRARALAEMFDEAYSAAKRDVAAVSRSITALQAQLERQGRSGSVERAAERPRTRLTRGAKRRR